MDELVKNLTKLAAAFPRDHATEATLAVYIEELAGLNQETLAHVLPQLIRSATRFPTVAEIRDAYSRARQRELDSGNVRALPIGRASMPAEVKAQLDEFLGRVGGEDR